MEDFLIEILSTFGFPIRRQGSLLENEPYPDSFFTFWSHAADTESSYDNKETTILYEYDVNFYSTDIEKAYAILRKAKEKLRQNGFEAWGDGYDVPSDENTHFGRGMNVSYLKNLMEE